MVEVGQDGNELTRFERELGASLREFEHGLNLATSGQWTSPRQGTYRIIRDGAELEIEIMDQGERRIAALCIPLLSAVYTFKAGSIEQRRRLLARLDLAMQRGGG